MAESIHICEHCGKREYGVCDCRGSLLARNKAHSRST